MILGPAQWMRDRERGKRERGKRERFKVSVTSPLTKHESTHVRSNDAWLIRTLKFEKQREVNYQLSGQNRNTSP